MEHTVTTTKTPRATITDYEFSDGTRYQETHKGAETSVRYYDADGNGSASTTANLDKALAASTRIDGK